MCTFQMPSAGCTRPDITDCPAVLQCCNVHHRRPSCGSAAQNELPSAIAAHKGGIRLVVHAIAGIADCTDLRA